MESSLSAQFKDLKADVGFFIGFGRGADFGETAFTALQLNSLDRCIKGGMRNFYHCGYPWSFLKPVIQCTLLSGKATMVLPEDYQSTEGSLTVSDAGSAGTAWGDLPLMPVGTVYQAIARQPQTTGRPQICCEEPIKGTAADKGQRFQFHFWPTADQDYTLQFQYYLSPDYLSGAFPYCYGGPQHAETLLESCLAVAEKLLDDAATVHALEFEKRLAASQQIDARNKPRKIGYNGDRSDMLSSTDRDRYWRSWSPITQNGILY